MTRDVRNVYYLWGLRDKTWRPIIVTFYWYVSSYRP